MATIDVGPGNPGSRLSQLDNWTIIHKKNPANDTGTLDVVKIWLKDSATTCKVGTASGSGASWTPRDYASLGAVTGGSEQTFSGLSIDVVADDLLATYSNETQYATTTGGDGILYGHFDLFDAGTQTYNIGASYDGNGYATGTTASATSIKLVMGVPIADVKAINGVPIANIKQFNGVSNVS